MFVDLDVGITALQDSLVWPSLVYDSMSTFEHRWHEFGRGIRSICYTSTFHHFNIQLYNPKNTIMQGQIC